jgi:hypothetical protein
MQINKQANATQMNKKVKARAVEKVWERCSRQRDDGVVMYYETAKGKFVPPKMNRIPNRTAHP